MMFQPSLGRVTQFFDKEALEDSFFYFRTLGENTSLPINL